MFKAELSFFNEKQKSEIDKINENLDKDITEKQIDFSIEKLSKELLNIAPIKDYENKSLYLEHVKECILKSMQLDGKKTVKSFLEKIADIIVFLKEESTDIFKENIKKFVYTPYFLCNASHVEKFPEAILDVSENGLKNTTELNNIINRYVKQINTEYYYILYNTERRNTQPDNYVSYNFIINNWTNQCDNIETKREITKDEKGKYRARISTKSNMFLGTTSYDTRKDAENDYENIKTNNNIISTDDKLNKYNIIKYDEDGKTYCLLVKKILKNGTNYITDKKLNQQFYEDLKKKYYDKDIIIHDNIIIDDSKEEIEIDKKYTPLNKLAPNLFIIIQRKIEQYDNKKSNFLDFDTEKNNNVICYNCNKPIKENSKLTIKTINCKDLKKISFCNTKCCGLSED